MRILALLFALLLSGCASESPYVILPEHLQPSPSQAYLQKQLETQRKLDELELEASKEERRKNILRNKGFVEEWK